MRNLESTEICKVSGGDFWTKDGECFIGVPSTGIPSNIYDVIDGAFKMYVDNDFMYLDEFFNYLDDQGVSLRYTGQYIINIENANIYCN